MQRRTGWAQMSGQAQLAGGEPEPAVDPEQRALAALDRKDHDEALSVLMLAYGNGVFRYCVQVMRNHHLAEEVLQETFIQAYGGLARFRRQSSLRTWIFSIAHNRCLDVLKKEGKQIRTVEPMADPPDAVDAGPRPDRLFAGRELSSIVEECLEKLTPEARAAILLRFQHELTYPEMAAIVGAREATLQARVTRALPLVKECVERSGYPL